MNLTDEQKKILKTFSMYIQSYGSKVARISFEVGTDHEFYEESWGGWRGDNTSIGIPGYDLIDDLMIDIIKENDFVSEYFDYDNRGSITAIVNGNDNTLSFSADIYILTTRYQSDSWEFERLPEDVQKFISDNKGKPTGTVHYEGSGDSGYIESDIQIGGEYEKLPDYVESWLYSALNQYGGWEINEGSQGDFTFDFNSGEISLEHGENYEDEDIVKIDFIAQF